MKILLAVDGSKYTKKMLAYLTVHAELFAAVNDFTVFTAQAPLPPRARAAVGKDIADAYHAEESEKIVAPVCKFLARHGINAKSAWKVGHAGEAIAKFADAGKYDLVGSHAHSALTNLGMGAAATQVLAHCQVPVLLVR